MSKIFVDQVDPKTGTSLTLGTSGDTVNIPSGVTLANAGTMTGVPAPTSGVAASAIDSGTIATARLGSGTASSSTFLRGDQTYATAGFSTYGASAYSNATQTIATGTNTKVLLPNEYTDSNGEFASSTYTATNAGDYLLSAQVYENGETGANVQWQVFIYKNGSLFLRGAQTTDYAVAYTFPISAVVVPLAASDTIELYTFHNKGSNANINFDNKGTFLNIWRLK